MFTKDKLDRFRRIALIEGWSFLFLLGVAMPLKYWADFPLAVKVAGWIHGILFVLYCWALLEVWIDRKWSFGKSFLAFVVSLIPFGTFWFDKRLQTEIVKK